MDDYYILFIKFNPNSYNNKIDEFVLTSDDEKNLTQGIPLHEFSERPFGDITEPGLGVVTQSSTLMIPSDVVEAVLKE